MRLKSGLAALVMLLALIILPLFLSSYYLGLVVLMLIFGIFAMSLNILLGYCGLPSLGHTAFFGVAAYTTGYLALNVFDNFWLEAAGGLGLSVFVAAIFGFLVLRTRGVYFMMITLALSQVLWGIAFKWTSVTHGEDGLSGIPRPDLLILSLNTASTTVYYYFTLVIFIVVVLSVLLLVVSPFGLVLKGIRDSETRMRALGYNVWLYQYLAFLIAAFFASAAGILAVYYHGFVGPGDLHIGTSAKVLLMVILGGSGTLLGPIIGAFGIVLLENLVSGFTERWLFVLGLVYVLVVMFAPRGLYLPIIRKVRKW